MLIGCSASAPDGDPNATSADDLATAGHGYSLPWEVGKAYWIYQGEYGKVPGESTPGDHSIATMNHAIDFGLPMDTPVLAARRGTVLMTKSDVRPGDACYDGGGQECANAENYVLIRHDDGTDTLYLHFSRVWAHAGDVVKKGQEIGRSGTTGWSSGPHLHVQRQEQCADPATGRWFCSSVPLPYDDIGIPKAGSLPVAPFEGKDRCYCDELARFVAHDTCVQNKDTEAWWLCDGAGNWQGLTGACPAAAEIYGFCQDDAKAWVPERSCAPVGGAWKQCTAFGRWAEGVATLAGDAILGGPIGPCLK